MFQDTSRPEPQQEMYTKIHFDTILIIGFSFWMIYLQRTINADLFRREFL